MGKLVVGVVLELWAEGAGVQKAIVGPPGLPRRTCDPLQPARISVLPEGAGGAVAAARVAMERPGEIWVYQEASSGPIFNRPSIISNPTWLSREFHNFQMKEG